MSRPHVTFNRTAAFWQLIINIYMIYLSKRAGRVRCVLATGCYIGSQVGTLNPLIVKVSRNIESNDTYYRVLVIDYLLSYPFSAAELMSEETPVTKSLHHR